MRSCTLLVLIRMLEIDSGRPTGIYVENRARNIVGLARAFGRVRVLLTYICAQLAFIVDPSSPELCCSAERLSEPQRRFHYQNVDYLRNVTKGQ